MDLTSVFNSHLDADRMGADEVRALFKTPPGFSSCLRHTNQVIIGPRGSGKSIALRWLAFMPERTAMGSEPPFYGLWLGIGRFMVDYLRQYYRRTGDPRPFLVFFNLQLLEAILDHVRRYYEGTRVTLTIPAEFGGIGGVGGDGRRSVRLRGRDVSEFYYDVDDVMTSFTKALAGGMVGDSPEIPRYSSIQDTLSLLHRFHGFVEEVSSHDCIALLMDGVDHLGDLGRYFLPLMSKHERHAQWLLVKQTCRELPSYYYAGDTAGALEHGRDFHILPFGVYDTEERFEEHLRAVMEERIRRFSGNRKGDIDSILPSGPGRLTKYSGFSNLAKFAGGNVLTFLEACARGLQHELSLRPAESASSISAEAQRKGVDVKAEMFLRDDLDEQVRGGAPELRELLRAVGKYLESQKNEEGTRGIAVDEGFLEGTCKELGIPYFDAVARLSEFHYLVLPRPHLVATVRRRRERTLREMELSPTLAPLFGLGLSRKSPRPMVSADVEHWLSVLRTEKGAQGVLFSPGRTVFLSRTGDVWGDQVQRRMEDAVRRIEKNPAYPGTDWFATTKIVSFKEIEKKLTGNFRDNIFEEIAHADYVVCDVTGGVSSGIAIEFGIAAGLRRPLALCWFEDKPMDPPDVGNQFFETSQVPEELQPFGVKIRRKENEAFYRWYYSQIIQPCIAVNSMCGFRGSGIGCCCEDVERDCGAIYVASDPRNQELDEDICEEIQGRGFRVVRREGGGGGLSDTLCKRLRSSAGVLLDITKPPRASSGIGGNELSSRELTSRMGSGSGEVRQLIEVGYALGAGLPCGLFYDDERGHLRSSMLPGRRMGLPRERRRNRVAEFVAWFIREQVEQGE